jgi:hypothetical protein
MISKVTTSTASPLKVDVTYLLFIHHTEGHQTSSSTSFIVFTCCTSTCKQMTHYTHISRYFAATASLPLQNLITVCPVDTLCNSGKSNILPLCYNEPWQYHCQSVEQWRHGDKGEKLHSQNLWLSRWYWWRFLSSTIWCRVDWWNLQNLSWAVNFGGSRDKW